METFDPTKIHGWGADRRPEDRPGVPMERQQMVATTLAPAQQPVLEPVLKSRSVENMTAVFGTAVPPRGLSGAMRRAAYRIPEHKARHWLLLLLADRVDVVEGILGDLMKTRKAMLGAILGGGAALLIGGRLLRSR